MAFYQPQAAKVKILDQAMAYVQSVPYAVTARWLFYRLHQDGVYGKKGDYKNRFLPLITRARKSFYGRWTPYTLADDTRTAQRLPDGYKDVQEWVDEELSALYPTLDKWHSQERYVEIWFEAAAMRGQFEHYTRYIPLRPFRGDPSLDYKWRTARHLEAMADKYGKEIIILYFGDDDYKGHQILQSAELDIMEWCDVWFEVVRCGLNPGDGERYGIPENPDKPGQYQWEALDDSAAATLITDSLSQYVDISAMAEIDELENNVAYNYQEAISHFIDDGGFADLES